MITQKNGQSRTMDWESIGQKISSLQDHEKRYYFHLRQIANAIYSDFKMAKEQHDNDVIDSSDYVFVLKELNKHINSDHNLYPLPNIEEIKAEIEKHKIVC